MHACMYVSTSMYTCLHTCKLYRDIVSSLNLCGCLSLSTRTTKKIFWMIKFLWERRVWHKRLHELVTSVIKLVGILAKYRLLIEAYM